MPFLDGPVGPLFYLVAGTGDPTTLFVPGLAQGVAETRPFGSGVAGTRAFAELRGHGGSVPPPDEDGWSYEGLADDVRAFADCVRATQALGVSLGAAALVRLLADQPNRFERVVLALPAPLTGANATVGLTDDLADAVEAGDPIATGRALVRMQPDAVRGRNEVRLWARRNAADIGAAHLVGALRALPRQAALPSLDVLGAVTASVLVLAQHGDDVHPVSAAEELAAAIPGARIEVSDTPWIWGARQALRETVSAFLHP